MVRKFIRIPRRAKPIGINIHANTVRDATRRRIAVRLHPIRHCTRRPPKRRQRQSADVEAITLVSPRLVRIVEERLAVVGEEAATRRDSERGVVASRVVRVVARDVRVERAEGALGVSGDDDAVEALSSVLGPRRGGARGGRLEMWGDGREGGEVVAWGGGLFSYFWATPYMALKIQVPRWEGNGY